MDEELGRLVAAVIHPNGQMHKANGHTRTWLAQNSHGTWKPFKLPMLVNVYQASDLEDYNKFFQTFDSSGAVFSSADDLFGIVRNCGIVLNSSMKSCAFTTALEVARGSAFPGRRTLAGLVRFADYVDDWRDEIVLADSLMPKGDLKNSAVLGSILLTLRMWGSDVIPFWEAVRDNQWTASPTEWDAVYEAIERIKQYLKSKKKLEPRYVNRELPPFLISCAVQHLRGRSYRSKSKKTHLVGSAKRVGFRAKAEAAKAKRRAPKA